MAHIKSYSGLITDPDPFIQFDKWYKQHLASGISVPDSVSLGTASADGRVSVRTVLLKEYDETGFVFFTNYKSRKGVQISANPEVALLFYWPEAGRQVRIEGVAGKISAEESGSYFQTRPRESQLSACASEQSTVIPDRRFLEQQYEYYKHKFDGRLVEKPPFWGGFRISPDWFEFWQSGDFRLHDRLSYTKKNERWVIERLAP
jgi:pyridoxamine 5'-phosphate oxidase